MREELLKVLGEKLDSINKNIDSLNLINKRLGDEEENLDYVDRILDMFKDDNGDFDINNFSKLDRDDFDQSINLVPETTKEKFETNSCNYDGLIYLINGINSGISLTLTDEQKQAVELMINGLSDKKIDYQARIEGINLAKTKLEVSDGEQLENNKNKYSEIIDELDNERYVSDTESVMTAIKYANIDDKKTVDLLSYLLKYNADIYSSNEEPTFHKPAFTSIEDEIDKEYDEVHEEVADLPEEPSFEMEPEPSMDEEVELPTEEEPIPEEVPQEEAPIEEPTYEDVPVDLPMDLTSELDLDMPEVEEPKEITDEISALTTPTEEEPMQIDETANINALVEPEVMEQEPIPEEVSTEEIPVEESYANVNITPDELRNTLEEYHVRSDELNASEELLSGDLENYKKILKVLDDNKLVSIMSKNPTLLKNILRYSDEEALNNVIDIVKNDFSVDDDDYNETIKITIDSLPAIFVKEPEGAYNNFVKNIELFKRLNFDLINLFDFSRELLVTDNELLERNNELVSMYDVRVNEKNAKYLLALNNVVTKLDYYTEAVYDDKITKKTFDGTNIIRMYPSKLDSVCDLTIKRLRYSSENGKKMFGSRENSIAGEVANLKVDVLEIPDSYFANFFNNEFDDITNEEIITYEQMLKDNTNYVFTEDDVLKALNPYLDGVRYNIEGINISYNKVLRNYNILKNNNVDTNKALEFAICYNLVITKDEYMKLKEVLNTLGGK